MYVYNERGKNKKARNIHLYSNMEIWSIYNVNGGITRNSNPNANAERNQK